MKNETKNGIVLYQTQDQKVTLPVRVDDDTVWLNRSQMADLFDRDVKTIGKHIQNVMVEELKDISVVAKFATTEKDNKVYMVEYYSWI